METLSPFDLGKEILFQLPYVATDQQVEVIAALARFCCQPGAADRVFILNGYAGTGKTSLLGALVKALASRNVQTVLMAPTGRAAKVFGSFAGKQASTIHRRIYRHNINDLWTGAGTVAENNLHDAVFIVDEASMVAGESAGGNLLDDLIHYVFSGINCSLIFIGDTAQLPPVGCNISPAMDPATLKGYGMKVSRAVMTATVRQASESGILYNATALRRAMKANPFPEPQIRISSFDDVIATSSEELLDKLSDAYARDGYEETLIVTRSNKRAVDYNRAVRSTILEREELISKGERLLVVKNSYFWCKGVKGLDFIANGDMATVKKVYGIETKYGMQFADVSLYLTDKDIEFDCKIVLDCLFSDTPALSAARIAHLYQSIITDPELHSPATPVDVRVKMLRSDPYFNALQVKYAYAVTCHKAQGGQWRNIFVDMGYIPPEAVGLDFFRWLYTSVTRATRTLYLINPAVKLI